MRRTVRLWGFELNVILLGVTSLLNDVSSEIIYPLLPAFLTQILGAGPGYIGLIEGVAESTASVLKLLSGWLSDRLGRRKGLVVVGYAIAAVSRPLVAITSAPWQVLAVRFSDRAGKGLRSAPRDALLADSSARAAWGRAFSFHRAMDHLGAVIGPLLAFALTEAFAGRLRLVFVLASVPGILAVAVVAFGVRESASPHIPHASLPLVARQPVPRPLRTFLLIVFLFTLGNSTDAFLLLRAQDLGVPVAVLPLLWMVLHAVKSASSVPGGALSDQLGRKRVIAVGWLVYAAVYVGFAMARSPLAMWLLFAAYGFFFGFTEGVEKALVADLVEAADRGAAFGFYHLIIGVAALPASIMFGLLWASWGPGVAFGTGAGLATLAALLLSVVDRATGAPARRTPASPVSQEGP